MRDADLHFDDAGSFASLFRTACQGNRRFAAFFISDFDVTPANAFDPSGSQSFKHSLFGRPSSSIVLRRRASLAAVADFVLRVDATDKELTVSLDHLSDSQAFHNVSAYAEDIHCLSPDAF